MSGIADILGSYAAAAEPDEIRWIAGQIDGIGTTAASIHGGLSQIDSADWTGSAAEKFREKQRTEIPAELGKIRESFGTASQALYAYAANVAEILDEARVLAGRMDGEQQELQSAQRNERSAHESLASARTLRAAASDPVTGAHAQAQVDRAADTYASAVSGREAAQESLSGVEREAQSLRERLSADVQRCASELRQASQAGIRNNLFSAFDRYGVDGVPGAMVRGVVNEQLDAADRAAKDWSGFVAKHEAVLQDAVLVVAVVGLGIATYFPVEPHWRLLRTCSLLPD